LGRVASVACRHGEGYSCILSDQAEIFKRSIFAIVSVGSDPDFSIKSVYDVFSAIESFSIHRVKALDELYTIRAQYLDKVREVSTYQGAN
jgi:hypothetical protein